MRKRQAKFAKIQFQPDRKHLVRKRALKIEIRVGDQVVIFRVPGPEFFEVIDVWVSKYDYCYFKDKQAESTGHFLRPPWEKPEIPRQPGAKLRYYRIQEKLTQAALAEIVGSTQANIATMESGKRRIGKSMAKKLEMALDIDYRVFL